MSTRQVLVLFCCLALPAMAEDMKDPGAVTYVQGAVFFKTGGADFQPVNYNSLPMLSGGHAVRTTTGYVEMIPIKGAFLCLGGNGELELISRDDSGVTMKLHHGSIIIDALKASKKAPITVSAGESKTVITSSGEYRIDYSDAASGVQVKKGKATLLASGVEHELKRKQWAELSSSGVSLTKFKDFAEDDLTEWRNERLSYNQTVYTSREYFGMGQLPDAERAGIGREPGTSVYAPPQNLPSNRPGP